MSASDILKNHQIRKTPGRLAIVQTLQQAMSPLAETDIRERMDQTYDRTTFYRNIHVLLEQGVLHRIVVDNTTVRFALNRCGETHDHKNTHAHFYCETCHSVRCLHGIVLPEGPLPEGYRAREMDLVIKGICRACGA